MRDAVDARLAELLAPPRDADDVVVAAMRHGVLAPGKRIRALLMLATMRAFGLDAMRLIDAACAVEMVHAASLFLDDLPCMDDAQMRRGLPTLHRQYGEDVAVLASVALLSQAYRLVATSPGVPASVQVEMIVTLTDAVGVDGLVRGQARDLRQARSSGHALTARGARSIPAAGVEQVASTNELKTGSLFTASLELAALAANADAAARKHLRALAAETGQAFQLLDDLKDAGVCADSGKDLHQDDEKATLLSVLGVEASRERLKVHLQRAHAHVRSVFPDDEMLPHLLSLLSPGGASASRSASPSSDSARGSAPAWGRTGARGGASLDK
ncbi:MAG: geranylgeranyl pyrophosphate synthase [Rhizobacter sp.]|nr:geranylgeranyl pyrophosphate synthase [Rhizobacter sp.]